jgi:hypothetical protein
MSSRENRRRSRSSGEGRKQDNGILGGRPSLIPAADWRTSCSASPEANTSRTTGRRWNVTTKRKPAPEDPVKATRNLIDKIQKELSCTEAEAYFTLRCIASPPSDSFFANKVTLAAHLYRKKKKCSEEEAFSFVTPELEQAITPWDWAIFYTRGLLGKLEEYREKTEKGNFASFFRAVGVCGYDGFPLPMWIRERIGKAHADYSGHKTATTDEALRAKRPRYYRQDKARRDASEIPWTIFRRCREMLRDGGVTPDIFRIVGEEYGLSKTIVSNYYYAIRRTRLTD